MSEQVHSRRETDLPARLQEGSRAPAQTSATVQSERRGCPFHELREKLRRVGLRPTRQRVSLGWLPRAVPGRNCSSGTP